MKNKDDLDYGIGEGDCRVIDSRSNMICPTRSPELTIFVLNQTIYIYNYKKDLKIKIEDLSIIENSELLLKEIKVLNE